MEIYIDGDCGSRKDDWKKEKHMHEHSSAGFI